MAGPSYCYNCESAGSVVSGICEVCGTAYASPGKNPCARIDLKTGPGGCTAELHGELDIATRGFVEDALMSTLEKNREGLTVDLRRLDFMDSQGINMLLKLRGRAGDLGHPFRVRVGHKAHGRLMELAGLSYLLEKEEAVSVQASGVVADGDGLTA